jgi:hypothetical protein
MGEPSTSNRPAARRTLGQRLRRLVVLLVVAGVLVFALYTWAAWTFTYSEGERAGYVQKFSRKGWICKTWEGELAMANLPGAMPQIFQFTVRDAAVAAQINASMGERVTLHYRQHIGLPTSCFGDTEYFVHQVRHVEQ